MCSIWSFSRNRGADCGNCGITTLSEVKDFSFSFFFVLFFTQLLMQNKWRERERTQGSYRCQEQSNGEGM